MQKKSEYRNQVLTWIAGLFVLWLTIHYWDRALRVLQTALKAASPLLIGLVIAYIVNIIMSFWENRVFAYLENPWIQKCSRILSLVLSFLCIIGGISVLTGTIFPELWKCLDLLMTQIPDVIKRFQPYLEDWISLDILKYRDIDIEKVIQSGANWILSGAGWTLNSIVSGVGTVVSSVATFLIALIFSIYLLFGKEKLIKQMNALMDVYLPEKLVSRLRYVEKIADNSFHRYIVGQCTEAVVLGTLCMLGMLLLRFPYAVMIGCVVGVTALIPFVGAYIGAAVGALMILTESPIQAAGFLIYLVILQQMENNLIYPRVVGSSIGLPGIWVLAAITVGGSLGGVIGMMLSVPLMAAFYQLVRLDLAKRKGAGSQGDKTDNTDGTDETGGTEERG